MHLTVAFMSHALYDILKKLYTLWFFHSTFPFLVFLNAKNELCVNANLQCKRFLYTHTTT